LKCICFFPLTLETSNRPIGTIDRIPQSPLFRLFRWFLKIFGVYGQVVMGENVIRVDELSPVYTIHDIEGTQDRISTKDQHCLLRNFATCPRCGWFPWQISPKMDNH
jgi:hypothetical protein